MDCSAYPIVRDQRFIRHIHDRVNVKCRNVGADGEKEGGDG